MCGVVLSARSGDEEEKGDEDEDNDEPMMECDTPTLSTSSRRLRSSSASSPLPVAMEWKEEKEEKKDEVTRPVLMRPASMPLLQPTPPPSSASPLLFASLDPSTGHLVYLPATALVWKHVTSLVEFTHAAEAPNWAEDADEYGLAPDQVERMAARSARHASGERLKEEDKFRAERCSNGVSLLVSRQHDMYAQVGMAVSVNSHNTNWTGDYVKVKAGSLLADDVRQRVRMTGRATAGVDASADSDDQLPFIAALGLTTTAQIDDFLWLYGYWLGDGCLDIKSRGVDFCPKKQHDQEEVQKRLEALGFTVPSASVKVYNKADGRREFLVKDERWAGYFFAEYGPKYGVAAASSSRPHTHTGLITPLPKSVKWSVAQTPSCSSTLDIRSTFPSSQHRSLSSPSPFAVNGGIDLVFYRYPLCVLQVLGVGGVYGRLVLVSCWLASATPTEARPQARTTSPPPTSTSAMRSSASLCTPATPLASTWSTRAMMPEATTRTTMTSPLSTTIGW